MIPMPVSDLFTAFLTVVLFLPAVVIITSIVTSIYSGISSLFGKKARKEKAN